MNTMYLKVDAEKPDPHIVEIAARLICSGEVVAFPTETVYGMGARVNDEQAIKKIFAAKGRPADNPLSVLVDSWQQAEDLVAEVHEAVPELVHHFWPGPLTLVMKARPEIPEVVRAGLPSIGVRMPNHRVALELIKACGCALAVPSANISGHPSPTTAEHVRHDMNGRIAAILDGGPTGLGIESTVLDVTVIPFRILRPGAVSYEELDGVLHGLIEVPQMSGRKVVPHYRPRARVIPFKSARDLDDIEWLVDPEAKLGIALLEDYPVSSRFSWKILIKGGINEYSKRLYEILRSADQEGVDILCLQLPEEKGMGRALVHRILSAAKR